MFEKVTEIINEWDPLELLPFAPKDEYSFEVNELLSFLESKNSHSTNFLGKKIYEVFLEALGENVFTCTIEDCNKIATKIIGVL